MHEHRHFAFLLCDFTAVTVLLTAVDMPGNTPCCYGFRTKRRFWGWTCRVFLLGSLSPLILHLWALIVVELSEKIRQWDPFPCTLRGGSPALPWSGRDTNLYEAFFIFSSHQKASDLHVGLTNTHPPISSSGVFFFSGLPALLWTSSHSVTNSPGMSMDFKC